MNKTEIKQIILEEIEAALEEMNMSPEMMAADSRPEEDDFAFDKMDGEMYDDAGDPMEAVNEAEDPLAKNLIKQYKIEISNNKKSNEEELNPAFRMGIKRLEKGNDPKKVNNAVAVAITKINSEPDTGGMAAAMMKAAKKMNEAEAVNEDLRGLMAQGEKMAAFANKQSGYEGGVSSPVRGVLAAMTVAGAPDFDGDEDLKAYWTRRLTKAIETQMGRKYMSGLDEMARTSNIFKLSQNASLKDVLQFMQRVNDVLKTYKSPGQKRPKKRFTPEEMKALATAMLKPEGFTSKDVIAVTSYTSPAQANKFLAALEQKGLITITSVLKKSLVPDRDPNAPETRGRKAQSAEFDTADDPTGMDFSDFDNLDLSDPTSLYENQNNNNNNMSNNLTNYIKKVINEAKNPLAAKLKEVEAQGRIASLESKLAAIQEMIEETNSRLTRIDEDNEFSEMMDKKAVKDVRKQLKELERAEAKLQKEYDKVSGGRKKETVVDEDMPITNDEVAEVELDNAVDEVELEEDDLRFEGLNGVHDLKPMVTMNESLLRMQKLAGLITEGEYKNKLSLKENEGQGKYNKTLEVIKSFEDGKVLQDFLKTFPKGKDVSKADYFTFVEKYYNEGQDDYYNEANWKYILSGDMSVFDDIAESTKNENFGSVSDKAARRDNRRLMNKAKMNKAKDSDIAESTDNIQQYIDREDDISDIRGKKAGKDYKTIRIDFNKPMSGGLKGAVGSYARKKYGDNIDLDWRDSQEVEIDINRNLDESYTQYAAIIRDLYPGKEFHELTPSEQFKVRSTYEDFN